MMLHHLWAHPNTGMLAKQVPLLAAAYKLPISSSVQLGACKPVLAPVPDHDSDYAPGYMPPSAASFVPKAQPPSDTLSYGFAAASALTQRRAASTVSTGLSPGDAPKGGAVPESVSDETKRQLGTPGKSSGGATYESGYVAPHPSMAGGPAPVPSDGLGDKESFMPRAMVYDMAYLESIKPTHLPPKTMADRLGLLGVRMLRFSFDTVTGYGPKMTEKKWLQRIVFLETVAGVPGMVAGMLRHLHSLRVMRRDKGWIHCLLEEAENERMHLLTFLELSKPGYLTRALVLLAQGVFFNAYFLVYLLWPQVCHAFVGYLEEEAVRTYTHALKDIDEGKVWKGVPAPPIAQTYWGLPKDATMRDLILAVRADEACHSHVNHTLKAVKPDAANPFALGKSQLP